MDGALCGIGGKDSRSAAPKDEEGLKALRPENPVICGFNGAETDIEGVDAPTDVVVVEVG